MSSETASQDLWQGHTANHAWHHNAEVDGCSFPGATDFEAMVIALVFEQFYRRLNLLIVSIVRLLPSGSIPAFGFTELLSW